MWLQQINILRGALKDAPDFTLYFEFSIPRMGKRADAVVVIGDCIFVIEFKVGGATFDRHAIEQVEDYALDQVAAPLCLAVTDLGAVIRMIAAHHKTPFDANQWAASGYRPTPTIIEAARALYARHEVADITRSDADAINLGRTQDIIAGVIEGAKVGHRKAICFVTGVPGAGKTLAGLNIAAQRSESHADEHAVFLSGNGPWSMCCARP